MNNGQASYSDPGLYFTNDIQGQWHKLSNLVQPEVSLHSVNKSVSLLQFIQPFSNNLLQQTVLSTQTVLGIPHPGSVNQVNSENYFTQTTSANVPSGLAPINPVSLAINLVSLR